MSRIGAAVNIITTTTPSGDVGMTVSAVCSVTDDPATVLVCIGRSSRQYGHFSKAGIICVNVLSHEHEMLAPIFAGKGDVQMTERFTYGEWIRLVTGAPVLATAAASLDCTVDRSIDIGTHTVFSAPCRRYISAPRVRASSITGALIIGCRSSMRDTARPFPATTRPGRLLPFEVSADSVRRYC
jgi:flavin reductase